MKNDTDWLTWSPDEQRWLPQVRDNNSLKFDPDLSTPWREHIRDAHGLGPEAALDGHDEDLIYEITSEQALDLKNGTLTEHTPDRDMAPPLGCAHASIWCEARQDMGKGRKKIFDLKLAAAFVVVHGEHPPPPSGA